MWPYWSIWWLQTRIRSKNYTQPSYSQISELTCLTNHDIGSRFYPLTTKNRRGRFLMSLIPMKPFEKDSSFILQSNRNFVFAAFDCLFLSIAKDRVVIGVIFFLFWSTFQSHEYYGLFRVWNFLLLFVPPDDFRCSRASWFQFSIGLNLMTAFSPWTLIWVSNDVCRNFPLSSNILIYIQESNIPAHAPLTSISWLRFWTGRCPITEARRRKT